MTLHEQMGIPALKICPDCGAIGPRLINRCPPCEKIHAEHEKERAEREAAQKKIAERRANGFGPEWD